MTYCTVSDVERDGLITESPAINSRSLGERATPGKPHSGAVLNTAGLPTKHAGRYDTYSEVQFVRMHICTDVSRVSHAHPRVHRAPHQHTLIQ